MKYATNTEWDDQALTLMGVSVKDCDDPIGEFGTGLKYAIAYALRNGYTMSLTVDGKRRNFGIHRTMFKDEPQEMVKLGSKVLCFALSYGRNWEEWMACRELIANTLDEGGSYGPDATGRVVFETDMPFFDPMIPDLPVLFENDEVQVRDGKADYLYYKGFRVYKISSKYTWNIKTGLRLTEDRTLNGTFTAGSTIADQILEMPEIIQRYLMTKGFDFESNINIYTFDMPLAKRMEFNQLKNRIQRAIMKLEPQILCPTGPQQEFIDQAISKCPIPVIAPIQIHANLDKSIGAQAKDGVIILFEDCLRYPLLKLAAILTEEQTHLDTGFNDETRELQSYLFERWVDESNS